MRLSYALVAGRWHRYSPSHRSGHSFRSAGGFACFSVKHLSDPCWKCLTFSLKNLKNLLVDFYLCFRLPWWVQFWRFLFSGCIWHRCFNILRITQRIKHARKHLWDWVHRKLEKKVKTMSSPLVLTFWSHSIVVTFPDKKQTELTFVHPKYVYRVYVLIFIRPVLRHISVNPSEFIFMISYWIIHNLLRQVWCSIIDLVPRSTYLYNINDYQR